MCRSFGDRHPKLVLLYAAHHGYLHVIDERAQCVVTSESIEYFTPLLPDHLRTPWVCPQHDLTMSSSHVNDSCGTMQSGARH